MNFLSNLSMLLPTWGIPLNEAGLPEDLLGRNCSSKWYGHDNEENFRKLQGHSVYSAEDIQYDLNSFGYRCPEFSVDADIRVASFGCSVVFGQGLKCEEIFHEIVCRRIGAAYSCSVVDWNMGVSGCSNETIARLVMLACPVLKPHIVFIHFTDRGGRERVRSGGKYIHYQPGARCTGSEIERICDSSSALESGMDDQLHFYRSLTGVAAALSDTIWFFSMPEQSAYDEAAEFAGRKRFAGFLKSYDRSRSLHPGPESHRFLAELYLRHLEAELAAKVPFEKRCSIPHDAIKAGRHKGVALALRCRDTSAQSLIEIQEALALDRDDPEALFLYGQALVDQARYDDAENALKKALEYLPASACINRELSFVLLRKSRLEESLTFARQAVELGPYSADCRLQYAEALSRTGLLEEADTQYRHAIGLNSTDAAIRRSYAAWLLAAGRPLEALEQASLARKFDPCGHTAFLLHARALRAAGRTGEAEQVLKSALVRHPTSGYLLTELSLVLRTEPSRIDEAMECGARAVESSPSDIWFRIHYSDTLSLAGRLADAEIQLRAARAIDHHDPELCRRLVACLEKQERCEEAQSEASGGAPQLERSDERLPVKSDYYAPRGYIHHRHRFLFFDSRKAGCTAIWRWFRANNPELITKDDFREAREDPAYSFCSLQTINSYLSYTKIFFIRDPLRRAVSAYYEKFVCRAAYGVLPLLDFAQLEQFAQAVIKAIYAKCNRSLESYDGITFEDYLTYLAGHWRDFRLNAHWRPQLILHNIEYDFIDILENMNQVVNEVLNPQFGYTHPMKISNTSNLSAEPNDAGYLGNIPSVEIAHSIKNAALPAIAYDNFLNVKTEAAISKLYARDAETYAALKKNSGVIRSPLRRG